MTLALPAGPYLRVEGSGITLTVGGQSVSGDITFTQSGSGATATTIVSLANITAGFGDGTTTFVALSNGSGTLTLDTTGMTGNLVGIVTVSVPDLALTGTLALSVTATTTTSTLTLSGTDVSLVVGGVSLTGSVSIQQSGTGATRAVAVTLSPVVVTFGAPLTTFTATGGLVISQAGLTGRVSVSASPLALGDVTATGTVTLEVNTARAPVVVAGTSVPPGPFVRLLVDGVDGAAISLGTGGPVLHAAVSIQRTVSSLGQPRVVVAVLGGRLSLDGATDLLTGIQGVFVLTGAGLAGRLAGTVNLAGLLPSSVTVAGTFALAVNRTGTRVTESVTLGGATTSLDLAAGTYVRVAATGATVAVGGQSLSGDVSFVQSGTTTQLTFANVSMSLGGGLLTASNGTGAFTFSGTGTTRAMAGTLTVHVELAVPQVAFGSDLTLDVNTATSTFRVGGTGLALTVAGQQLGGTFWVTQSTSNGARTLTVTASSVFAYLGTGAAALGTCPTSNAFGVCVTAGSGSLRLTSAGLAMSLAGTLTPVGMSGLPVSFGSTAVSLDVNTTGSAVSDTTLGLALPAGPFVRVSLGTTATPVTVTLLGQSLSGAFALEKATTAGPDGVLGTTDDASVLRLAATGVQLFLGDDGGTPGAGAGAVSDDIGLRVTDGTAFLLFTPTGFAGRISATATLRLGSGIPAVSAAVTVEINQLQSVAGTAVTPLAVDQQVVVGGVTQRLQLAAGRYVTVTMTGVALTIGGQQLTTDVSVQRRAQRNLDGTLVTPLAYDTTIAFAHLGLRLGSAERDIVRVTDGTGSFTIVGASGTTPGGVYGLVTATVAVDIPGVTFSGGLLVQVNTLAAARTVGAVTVQPGVTVAGTGVTAVVAGQRLTGDFAVTKAPSGTVTLVLHNVALALGDGTTTVATATVADGALVVSKAGVAGALVANLTLSPTLSANLALSADLVVQVNTTGADVTTTVDVTGTPGYSVSVSVPKNTLRVQVGFVGHAASVTVYGQTLTGVVVVEQTRTSGGAKVVRIGFTQVSLFLGAAGTGVQLANGSGAFLVTASGYAGVVEGDVSLVGFPVTVSGHLVLQVNSLGVAVNDTIQFAGVDVTTTTGGTPTGREAQLVSVGRSLRHLHPGRRPQRERHHRPGRGVGPDRGRRRCGGRADGAERPARGRGGRRHRHLSSRLHRELGRHGRPAAAAGERQGAGAAEGPVPAVRGDQRRHRRRRRDAPR